MSTATPPSKKNEEFFKQLSVLVKNLDCKGKKEGEPALPPATKDDLTLDDITRLKAMMQQDERLKVLLDLGANPEHEVNGITLEALVQAFGDEKIKEVLENFAPPSSKSKIQPRANKKRPKR